MQVGNAVQFHVAPPFIDTTVIPAGAVSVTVTIPLVGDAPLAFDTVMLYVAPFCPCVKLFVCVLVILWSRRNGPRRYLEALADGRGCGIVGIACLGRLDRAGAGGDQRYGRARYRANGRSGRGEDDCKASKTRGR